MNLKFFILKIPSNLYYLYVKSSSRRYHYFSFHTPTGCICNKYRSALEICNGTCANTAIQTSIKQDDNGKQTLIMTTNGVTTIIPIEHNYGLNDFDRTKRHLEFVTMTEDGSYGIVATETDQLTTYVILLNVSIFYVE